MGMGIITTEHTVWCGTCEKWEQFCDRTIKRTTETAKHHGWKKIKGLWACPKCVAAMSKEKE